MSNKLISLVLNKRFGTLEAQEVEFTQDKNKLIQVKGVVGSGKSSTKNAISVGLSAGSERELPLDMKKYEGLDIETQLTVGDNPVFMHTKYENGSLTSTAYIKDVDGKKATNPVINGKKFTPAALRDHLKTELTFGAENFISENPKVQMDFMMKVYKDKLKEKGVVFDKKDPKYRGSILYELEQAKAERSMIYTQVTALNAYKKRLEEEGYSETNIPDFISIEDIEKEQKAATKAYYDKLSDIDRQISECTLKASEYKAVVDSYNRNIETEVALANAKLKADVDEFNKKIKEQEAERLEIYKAVDFLLSKGFTGISEQYRALPELPKPKQFYPKEAEKIPTDDKGRYIRQGSHGSEVDEAFEMIDSLRKDAGRLLHSKGEIKEPDQDFQVRIDAAKESNKIAKRWSVYFDHRKADEKVKEIFARYRKIFTTIDLGVPGLKMMLLGNDDDSSNEIRTTYNGEHDPEFFGNPKKEARNIAAYSETQKNVLAILEQIYLLEEKKKRGEDGLRYLFLDVPIDAKTRDMLIDIQNKYDLQLITTSTGDYELDKINDGEILIQNGYLMSKEVK